VDGVFATETCATLSGALRAMRQEALHPAFVFVYDEPWQILERVAELLSSAIGIPMEPVADFWAWHVDPRVDAGGWTPHRGWYEDIRGSDGLPSLVTVWLSLSRATPRNACMHLVPLGDDPAWPDGLDRRPFDTRGGKPIPTEPGALLAWNANLLHWGGQCDSSARDAEPRCSLSFSLVRRGWTVGGMTVLSTPRSLESRLDLIAEQMSVYGARDLSPDSPLLEWAAALQTMRRLGSRTRTR
jgi:hypothetical protein